MARRRKRRTPTRDVFKLAWILWAIGWPILRFCGWLVVGLAQGMRLGYYEANAARLLVKWRRQGISLYETRAWRYVRKVAFEPYRTDRGTECAHCGILTNVPHGHHVQWVSKAPHLALTVTNVLPLCQVCHQDEHPDTNIIKFKRRAA